MQRQMFFVFLGNASHEMWAIPANTSLLIKETMATEGFVMEISRTTPKRAINAALKQGFAENLDDKLGYAEYKAKQDVEFCPYANIALREIPVHRAALKKYLP